MIEYQKNVLRGIEQYKEEIEKLKQENNQLKQALIIRGCYRDGFCDFCGWHEAHPHADDCEYVRLTGGVE